jgi:hypothetical protein
MGNWFWGYWRIRYGNSFRTFVFVRFYPSGTGSRVHVRYGISPFVTIFMVVWFGLLALIGGGMFVYAFGAYLHGNAPRETWVLLGSPAAMVAAGAGLVRFGRWLARNEKGLLTQFLREELSAV